ncbi:MAG TPA: response regulator [Gammaproteobacteria bacterium]|nr:response regulator [Gammaproteobacteria bacterium]
MARILTVDDSKAMRDLMIHILGEAGHEVTTAEDGVQALAIARENTFDLALIDVNMPNMNGLSLVSKLRRLDDYQYIPLIMVTTETSDYRKNKAKTMGATGWLTKPFTAERLLGAVNKVTG